MLFIKRPEKKVAQMKARPGFVLIITKTITAPMCETLKGINYRQFVTAKTAEGQ
jgi:hypothetical protein